ncbi:type III PLP-dependent enzyme [Candidatus Liberibacter sp.]|uniref:type III PLP-dependent enzyme n=1 Tax=Candidatus Liberibacter sp. TaxID=34022 RepID=UPI0015F63287|nr:type III PLP-dependent enzyme [Candidatus Liberibacter sp.]MBA5724387.1 type III PLP-dependent enzyme [Candidatus Liberibacter sp.]
MITSRIRNFLEKSVQKSPFLVIDLEVVRKNFNNFRQFMSGIDVYYAVKANPDFAILKLLKEMGSSFDCASIKEIEMVLAVGVTSERISYGNTIKKESDIAAAYAQGIRLFAVDSFEEVAKVSRAAPGSRVFCRILCDAQGAEWPLSYKFGCVLEMAIRVLLQAHHSGLEAYGVSFHVGSQMTELNSWNKAISDVKYVFSKLLEKNISLKMINMGGGFPTQYLKKVPTLEECAGIIKSSLDKYFDSSFSLQKIIEPGRSMLANAGVIKSEVVLVSKKSESDKVRWVFLDIGKFGGLAETTGEAIRYRMSTRRDSDIMVPCILAGPTCDSMDVLYQEEPYHMPVSLMAGDEVLIENTGAYTTTYSTVAFNGFEPLKSYVI